MNMKEELIKLRDGVVNAFKSADVKEMETIVKSDASLGANALNTAIDRLIARNRQLEEENRELKETLKEYEGSKTRR